MNSLSNTAVRRVVVETLSSGWMFEGTGCYSGLGKLISLNSELMWTKPFIPTRWNNYYQIKYYQIRLGIFSNLQSGFNHLVHLIFCNSFDIYDVSSQSEYSQVEENFWQLLRNHQLQVMFRYAGLHRGFFTSELYTPSACCINTVEKKTPLWVFLVQS